MKNKIFVFCLAIGMAFIAAGGFAATKYEPVGEYPSPEIATEQELRAIIAELQAQIQQMSAVIDELSRAYIPSWLGEETGFDFAIFAESACFGPVREVVEEHECASFVVYNTVVRDEWNYSPDGSVKIGDAEVEEK